MNHQLFERYPDLVTVAQAREMLQKGRVYIYKLIQSGAIRAKKEGRDYRIIKQSIIGYLTS